MAIIKHHFDFPSGPNHTRQLGKRLLSVWAVVQHAPGIAEIKAVVGKRELFCVSNQGTLRAWQSIDVDGMLEVLKGFLRQVNAAGYGPRPEPLQEVGPGPKADLQHPLAMVAGKLGKGMNNGGGAVAALLDLLKVLAREFRCPHVLRIATLAIPIRFDLSFEIGVS